MRIVILCAVAALAACHGGPSAARPYDCVQAWNAKLNAENRLQMMSAQRQWRVSVSHFFVDHPGPEFTSNGCSFFFYDHARYLSFSMAWRCDGRVVWEDAITQGGRVTPEQRVPRPNAAIDQGGKLIGGTGSSNRGSC